MSKFMTAALGFVRERSKQALQAEHPKDHLLDLAAHFYALACLIPTETGSAELHKQAQRERRPIREALGQLQGPMSAAPSDLFWNLVGVLQSIEDELIRDDSDDLSFATRTQLEASPILGLSGEVVHWIHPASEWRSLRLDRLEEGGKRHGPPGPAPHPGSSLPRLALHWNADPRKPRVVPPQKSVIRFHRWLDRAESRRFRIALCPLPRSCNPHFEVLEDGFFRAKHERSIHGWDHLESRLEALFEAAYEERVHLLALPELMGDEQVEEYVRANFRASRSKWPWGVIAGSFHRWPDGGAAETRHPVNRAVLWSRPGNALLRHDKRGKFRVSRTQYEEAGKTWFPEGPDPLPPEIDELVELIEHDANFHVLDTALGRFVMVICTDCIAKDHTALVSLVQELRPDFVFIVSMTPETEPFEDFMKNLSGHGIASLFINAACICGPGHLLAAVDLGLHEPRGAPATRFRWRASPEGTHKVEQQYYDPGADGEKGWHEPDRDDPGARLLLHGGKPIALMVDLAPHFTWGSDEP